MESKVLSKNHSSIRKKSFHFEDFLKEEYHNKYDQKIEEDFHFIIKKQLTQKSKGLISDQKEIKSLNYYKWYKICLHKKEEDNNLKDNLELGQTLDSQNRVLKKNQSTFVPKKSFISNSGSQGNSNKKIESSKYSISEANLRDYFRQNKEKFEDMIIKGPPENFRWISWVVQSKLPRIRSIDKYTVLLDSKLDSASETQIKKDLHRTLTDDNLFKNERTQKSLFNVLKAFALRDTQVDYCQGMNSITGVLLIVSDYNEIDAYYLMLSMFSYFPDDQLGIRGFFLPEFPLLQLYLYQFDYIFYKKMPRLKKHFEKLEIPHEAWISKWFQTLFSICMPLSLVVRLWDLLFVKGLSFLFNFSIALLQNFEEDLIKFNDMIDLTEYLKEMNPYQNKGENKQEINVEKLIQDSLKIDIPSQIRENLRKEYEKIHNINMNQLKIKYDELNECYFNFNLKELSNLVDDVSVIEHNQTEIDKGEYNDLKSFIVNEAENDEDSLNNSVNSEFGGGNREINLSEKIQTHAIKINDLKEIKSFTSLKNSVQDKHYSLSSTCPKDINKKIIENILKKDSSQSKISNLKNFSTKNTTTNTK